MQGDRVALADSFIHIREEASWAALPGPHQVVVKQLRILLLKTKFKINKEQQLGYERLSCC
jgi:hypothetical protein